MKVLDTSKHAKEATWHTRIDPWSTGYKCMGQIGICYNIDVVTTRHKDRGVGRYSARRKYVWGGGWRAHGRGREGGGI